MGNTVSRYEEAVEYIYSIEDSITKSLMLNANFHLRKKLAELDKSQDKLAPGLDMLFFNHVLLEIFKEHDVLRKYLDGEEVGKWFED